MSGIFVGKETGEQKSQNLIYSGIIFDTLWWVIGDLQSMHTESTDVPPAYKEGWNDALREAALKLLGAKLDR
jgi:hypothetical protein